MTLPSAVVISPRWYWNWAAKAREFPGLLAQVPGLERLQVVHVREQQHEHDQDGDRDTA